VSVLIESDRIVTAAADYVGDVFVDGKRITVIDESLDVDADRVLDASGKHVLPGAGPISPNRMVELLSINPAKLFGLYPRKGTIAPGSDADIVIFDPEKQHLITAADQHSKVDYNLYEGTEVTGSPEIVLLRGNVLVESGELVAEPGVGQFVERAAFGQELLPAAAR